MGLDCVECSTHRRTLLSQHAGPSFSGDASLICTHTHAHTNKGGGLRERYVWVMDALAPFRELNLSTTGICFNLTKENDFPPPTWPDIHLLLLYYLKLWARKDSTKPELPLCEREYVAALKRKAMFWTRSYGLMLLHHLWLFTSSCGFWLQLTPFFSNLHS